MMPPPMTTTSAWLDNSGVVSTVVRGTGGMRRYPFRQEMRSTAELRTLAPSIADDGLGLEVFLQTVDTVFAAIARALVAAERRVTVPCRVVDVHLPGADQAGDAACPLRIARLQMRTEAVDRVVGDRDRLGLVAVRHDHQHRPEDFLLRDPHPWRHVGEHRRPCEEAVLQSGRPARPAAE